MYDGKEKLLVYLLRMIDKHDKEIKDLKKKPKKPTVKKELKQPTEELKA